MSARWQITLQDAFVLHRHAYRDTSLLLDVLSRDFGRLRLIAKGARTAPAKRLGALQPFVPLTLSWTGAGELPVLTAAESRPEVRSLSGNSLFCGFYMNELLLRFLAPRDPHPGVFELYGTILQRLQRGECPEVSLRCFEVSLLNQIGYGLMLDRDAMTHAQVVPDRLYRYDVERGGPFEAQEGADRIRGSTLLGLKHQHLQSPAELSEAKRLMRRIITHYLGGRPLRSRDMFRSMSMESNR